MDEDGEKKKKVLKIFYTAIRSLETGERSGYLPVGNEPPSYKVVTFEVYTLRRIILRPSK